MQIYFIYSIFYFLLSLVVLAYLIKLLIAHLKKKLSNILPK